MFLFTIHLLAIWATGYFLMVIMHSVPGGKVRKGRIIEAIVLLWLAVAVIDVTYSADPAIMLGGMIFSTFLILSSIRKGREGFRG